MAPDGISLWYLYDERLPNRYTASLQIIRTGAAFADLGNRFTFLAGPLAAPEADILARYGVQAKDGVHLKPFFPGRDVPAVLRRLQLRRRVRQWLKILGSTPGTHVVMSRGETAIAVLPLLHKARAAKGRSHPLLIQEMHCLDYRRQAEKISGRTLDEAEIEPRYLKLKDREAAAVMLADGMVYLTPAVQEAAHDVFGVAAPALVLPSGTDASPDLVSPSPPKEYDIVYAGKIEARKGVFDVCAAMKNLPGRTLALAGGPEAALGRLRQRSAELGVSDQVTLESHMPASSVDAFLQRGRVGVCPMAVGMDSVSDRFTSPMKLLQMMANGMAVAAADVAPVRAIATHEKDALLTPPDDTAAMARALQRLLTDTALAARLGEAARETAKHYDWSVRARKLDGFLRAFVRPA